jgi:hypothetical protein
MRVGASKIGRDGAATFVTPVDRDAGAVGPEARFVVFAGFAG